MKQLSLIGAFNVYDFYITHRQPLPRTSSVQQGKPLNIDILFKGVEYIEMATFIEGKISIEKATKEEDDQVHRRCPGMTRDVYGIRTSTNTSYIVAAFVTVLENDSMPFESPIPRG